MENKKGIALSQAFGAVLIVILVAVLVIIALVIFGSIGNSFTATATATNETGGFINNTGYTLTDASVCNFANPSITSALNSTSGGTILAGNYSVTGAGVVTNATLTTWNNVTFTYTYTWGTEACTASDDMITQFATYPVLVGLVGTIIFLGLIIGVLIASFVFGGGARARRV